MAKAHVIPRETATAAAEALRTYVNVAPHPVGELLTFQLHEAARVFECLVKGEIDAIITFDQKEKPLG